MNIVQRVLSKIIPEKRAISYDPTTVVGLPYGFASSPLSTQLSMQLSVVYRCVDVVSDAVASQTWEVQEYNSSEGFVTNPFSKYAYLLNYEPNPAMSRFTIMKTLVSKTLLEGNGYLWIRRDPRGDPERLDLVTSPVTMFMRKDGTTYYEFELKNYPGESTRTIRVEGYDMIHVLNFTYDGLIGVSTLRHAANSTALSYASEKTARAFYVNGANASGIMRVAGRVTKEKVTEIKNSFKEALNLDSGDPGGIVIVEQGLEFSPITVPPKDAQLLESRKFNGIELCRFFGVSPAKVFDSDNLTYSNIESFQLGFLTDTVSPWDIKIENEFNRKLLRPSLRMKTKLNLDIEELLRADLDSKSNYISKMFQCGGFTVNEVRKQCRTPKFAHENADKPMAQINLMSVDMFGSNKQKPIDKKVKLNDNGKGDQDSPV